MKHWIAIGTCLACACSTALAQSTVYTYTSKPYLGLQDFPIDTQTDYLNAFTPFTQEMRLEGSITAEQAFPGGLVNQAIGPNTNYPVTWSFKTGLRVLDSSQHQIQAAQLSTDADGNITKLLFYVISARPPYEQDQYVDNIMISYPGLMPELAADALVGHQFTCTPSSAHACTLVHTEQTSAAIAPAGGSWSRTTTPPPPPAPAMASQPVPVPGLGGLAVLGLGALLVGLTAGRAGPAKRASALRR